ncbi:CPBP family intramembrane glutamic endopeptidase [Corynebacterium pseudopelargi]|uniref:CAAX amino terminal protease self-immunity n=1 Tax=Corynebacterium pseudopelargi TaxID=2080757 RepID=A0A3G6IXL3_9CORY|nr:CPBP family intramembrane glutamic endopeptidase [Corynebacterium pseudopelargi]AZA09388.1 CAAX amino terminal protease self- immunity [Corynebacterium pseudopelargi]
MLKQLLAPTLIYAAISTLGFSIISALFNVEYSDPKMQYLGISFMLVSAAFVAYLLRGRLNLKAWNGSRRLPRHYRYALGVLSIATLVTFIAAPIEFALRGVLSPLIFAAAVLSLLIGFSEEGFFRKFILDHVSPSASLRSKATWLIASVLLFGLLHMTNVLSGMPVGAALDQSIKAMPMGLVAGLIYLRTRAFVPLLLWHASIDFTLFANAQQPFYFGGFWGIIIDACVILLTVFVIWDVIKALRTQRSGA